MKISLSSNDSITVMVRGKECQSDPCVVISHANGVLIVSQYNIPDAPSSEPPMAFPEVKSKPVARTNKIQIEDEVFAIIHKKLGAFSPKITCKSDFIDDLGADSLDMVDLIMTYEDAYNIKISDSDAEKIHTIGDAVEYIYRRIN